MEFPRLEGAAEYLDEPEHEPKVLAESLAHVAAVNRWLGGSRALIRHLESLIPAGSPSTILDVGTGSADLPRAVVRWARRRDRAVSITATDLHEQTLAVARQATAGYPEIVVESADARALPYEDNTFHVALLSMTLHHFEGEDQVVVLQELGRVARSVVVGDLERSWPNYLGARLLAATVWRRNRVTRHDGPLSVQRAFTAPELLDLARRAGLAHPSVHRHPFYRLVLRAGVREAAS